MVSTDITGIVDFTQVVTGTGSVYHLKIPQTWIQSSFPSTSLGFQRTSMMRARVSTNIFTNVSPLLVSCSNLPLDVTTVTVDRSMYLLEQLTSRGETLVKM